MQLFWLCIISVAAVFGDYTSYKDHKIYSVKANSQSQAEALSLWHDLTGIDFWDVLRPDKYSRILVAPEQQEPFDLFLEEHSIEASIVNDDVEETLEWERAAFNLNREEFSFDTYWTLEKIYSYITILNSKYPTYIQVHDLAMSHEERPIKSVTIALDGVIGNNPIVFIDNAIQGTDWMGLMSVAFLIYQLVEQSAAHLDVLQAVDWVIIPVVNPDGLVYSQTVDRFWCKNRTPIEGSDCVGVNLNRNFDLVWQPSKNPCGSAFSGLAALSEIESRSIATLMADFATALVKVATMNANELLSMYEFKYDYDVLVGNWEDTKPLDESTPPTSEATLRHKLTSGLAGAVLYLSSGNIEGYQVTVNNARIAYNVEGEFDSSQTFLWPSDQIGNAVHKVFIGFKTMVLTTVAG